MLLSSPHSQEWLRYEEGDDLFFAHVGRELGQLSKSSAEFFLIIIPNEHHVVSRLLN
jgi:hypothetical protein